MGQLAGNGANSPMPLLALRGTSTGSVGHLHTLLDLAVLLSAQACDPPGQHASVRPDELTEQQHILVEMENRR